MKHPGQLSASRSELNWFKPYTEVTRPMVLARWAISSVAPSEAVNMIFGAP